MSFPTTLWGNLSDIYTAIPGPTATSPGSSDGPVLGNAAMLADGSIVQFLQFAATTAANKACTISTSFANYLVTPTTAANQLVMAVNDLTGSATGVGASVTTNYCAWGKVRGLCFPLVAASTAAGSIIVSSAASGTLALAVAATDFQGNIANNVVVGGSAAASPSYMM